MTVISSDHGAAHREPAALTIRRAKGIDAPAIAQLRAAWRTGGMPSHQFTALMRTWLEAEGEPRITLTASLEEEAIGMVSMLEYRGMPEPDGAQSRWGYLDHLFVKETERRKGVAAALIQRAISIADDRGYERILVSPNAAALTLFDRLGFSMLDELGPEGILLWRQKPRPAL